MPKNSDSLKIADLESDVKEAISLQLKSQKLLKKVLKNIEKIDLMRDHK